MIIVRFKKKSTGECDGKEYASLNEIDELESDRKLVES
jgi:hypothetical protein